MGQLEESAAEKGAALLKAPLPAPAPSHADAMLHGALALRCRPWARPPACCEMPEEKGEGGGTGRAGHAQCQGAAGLAVCLAPPHIFLRQWKPVAAELHHLTLHVAAADSGSQGATGMQS